uniref:Glutathione S-transferase T3 n=1 Tax=Noccaea caerulescens TaxID=107243 RepID=A0A1J3GCX0_NOCCA
MDSTNSSYVDLLTSQQNSFSQGIDLESTEVPFYFQSPDAPVLEAKTHKGRRKWSPAEDNVLISAWLNTSKDAIVGNQQKGGTFWKRIAAYFASSPKLSGLPPREPSLCKQRWQKITKLRLV